MKVKENVILIQVLPDYIYDARIQGFGKESDTPGMFTAWGWANHLKEKNWWNKANEKLFLELAETITQKQ